MDAHCTQRIYRSQYLLYKYLPSDNLSGEQKISHAKFIYKAKKTATTDQSAEHMNKYGMKTEIE